MIRRTAWWLLLLAAPAAFAHEPSRSLVTLDVDGASFNGRWDISLRDLEDAVGLDANGDSAVTWGELAARHDEVIGYAVPRLRVIGDSSACELAATPGGVDTHGGAAYAVLELAGRCASAPRRLQLDYGLLFEIDRAHRGVVNVRGAAGSSSGIVSAASPTLDLELADLSWSSAVRRFVAEGVRHILEGYDHLAFVALLLFPIVLGRGARVSVRSTAAEIVRVVTAFTAAHSLTLALAATGSVAIPTRLVEVAIAASVLLAAVLNVVPNAPRLGAKLAFGFGLVHGFGFANALGDLAGGDASLLASLAGFNIGVELGQLAVVAALLPFLFLARRRVVSRFAVNALGSTVCAAFAVVWLAERLH